MSNNNWSKWGDDIRRTVDYSIRSGDFSQLNQDVGRIIEYAIKNVHQGLEKAGNAVDDSLDKMNQKLPPRKVQLYRKTGGAIAAGIVLLVIGFIGTGSFLGAFVSTLVKTVVRFGTVGIGGVIGSCILAGFLGGSVFMIGKGISMIGLANRFQYYVKYLGKKMTCTIEDLAAAFGKRPELVKKDVQKMIKKGYFLEGHLDELEGRLIVSDEYYNQYRWAKEQYLMQEQERARQEKEKVAKEASIPENVRQIIAEGEAFIKKIHASNDAIPGEEISAKIDRMEEIVRKIFQRVEQKPELASDMKKMMSYYLPTTIKLLDVYEEMDAQPIQGPNIQQSKMEIEQTMDTLNVAFEKLLDSFYQETAWDVSSDISVLQTMLAQEGLTKSDFEKENK